MACRDGWFSGFGQAADWSDSPKTSNALDFAVGFLARLQPVDLVHITTQQDILQGLRISTRHESKLPASRDAGQPLNHFDTRQMVEQTLAKRTIRLSDVDPSSSGYPDEVNTGI